MSSFSSEIQNALKTPTSASYHMPDVHRDVREASIAVILDTEAEATGQAAKTKVDSGCTFTDTKFQESCSLMPRGSVQKLLQITGAGSAASLALSTTSLTPSGHNSGHKVKQIMGVEVPVDEAAPASRRATQEISPLTDSSSSSIYSQDRGRTVSEADTESRHELEQQWTPGTTVTLSSHLEAQGFRRSASAAPSAVPASLHIVKTKDRSMFCPNLSPLTEPSSPTTNNYSHTNGAFRQDLYHATVSELAIKSSSSSSAYSISSSNSDRQDGRNFSQPGVSIVQLPKRQPSLTNRTYQSKTRFAPQLSKLDTLNAKRYNAPVKTPYPLPMSGFESADHGSASLERHYDSDGSYNTTTERPSLMDRITRHASSPLSPTSPLIPAAEATARAAPRSHASALPSPRVLQPPALLKHRKVKSQDVPQNHVFTVSNTSPDYPAPIGRPAADTPATTNRRATDRPQTYRGQPRRTASPMPPHHRGPTSHTIVPFIPPPNPYRSDIPPPAPRQPRPSVAEAAVKSLSTWAGRTASRLGQARQAAGILRTRSERRRSKLKSNIRVVGRGVVVTGAVPMVADARARGRETAGGGAVAGAIQVGGPAFDRYSPDKAAGKARGAGRAAADAVAETKCWI